MKPSRLLTLMGVALIVACSTYGADEPEKAPTDAGSSSSSGGASSSGNGSSSGGSSSGSDGSASLDAAADGPTYTETCPPCSGTCLASGCNGAGPNNACDKPYDVTASTTFSLFACPQGQTTATLPNQPACGNGGKKHGALLRLGPSTGQWNVKVQGTNPFAIAGDCNAVTSGQCNSSNVDRNFDPNITIIVGTSSTNIQTCVVLSVTLTKT